MNKRVALVGLWLAFAVAAVGVGFGASGLVDDPFTGASGSVENVNDPTPSRTATPSGSSSTSPSPSASATSSPSSTATGGASAGPVTRTKTTSGGSIVAQCRGGLVSVSASPAVGWELDDIDRGRSREARVRFERGDGDDKGRVDVRVRCSGGRPTFAVEERADDD